MRYLDTGSRHPAETLGAWFQDACSEGISHLRVQTGFYTLDGLAPLISILDQIKQQNLPAKFLIGSNDGCTLRDDVEELAHRLGIPRMNGLLGIVNFRGSYFHPKVYHLERTDGSQVAFVGSANLTSSGLELHAEAGIALDSREDGETQLNKIAAAIDHWFFQEPLPAGITLISGTPALDQLVTDGVLALKPPPRSNGSSGSGSVSARPAQARLLNLGRVQRLVTAPHSNGAASAGAEAGSYEPQASAPQLPPSVGVPTAHATHSVSSSLPVTTRPGFPGYLWFQPNATAATSDGDALSGTPLVNGARGLIVKLNRDSARHFEGRAGTANISLPVGTASTIRFGVAGVHRGPTAIFSLRMRYVADGIELRVDPTNTSVKGYGYTTTETGHGDIRLVVTAVARQLKDQITAASKSIPKDGDVALLEWPTPADPSFKLTFLDPQSALGQQAQALYTAGPLVGNSAWLPAKIAPSW